jgi:hypothetical protein
MSTGNGDARDPSRWVEIEHEHYIPLPAHLMQAKLCQSLPDEKSQSKFEKISTTLQLLIKHQYHDISEQLKSSYEIFDPVNANMTLDISEEERKAREGTLCLRRVLGALADDGQTSFSSAFSW